MIRGVVLAFVLAGSLVVGSCTPWDEVASLDDIRKRVRPSGIKVLIVGIDGATFSIVDPLLAEGKLPNTARLIDEGAHGVLHSAIPMVSPAVWTSVVTGRKRSDHGIKNFLAEQPKETKTGSKAPRRLTSSYDRRTAALWNILTAFDLTSGVIGWWLTWPAEEINGYIVSDRTTRTRWTEWWGDQAERQIYPEALIEELRPLVVDPSNPPIEEFDALIPWTEAERADFLDIQRPIYKHGPSVFKFAHCGQRSYEEIALHQLSKQPQPDLTAVFLVTVDPISHTFWHYFEPEKFDGVDLEDAARLGQLIPNYYQHNDDFLGRLLPKVDDETVVIIMSDHGFQASDELPESRTREEFSRLRADSTNVEQVAIGQSGEHNVEGIFIASGGPIITGAEVEARIHDITPTVLALMGLPVARDMPGRVLTEIVEEVFWQKNPIRYIDSYERLIPREMLDPESLAPDEELFEQLKALGYVDDAEE
jgi:hypothetical protein